MSNLIQNGGFETAASFCPEGSCISNLPQWIAPWTLTKGADFQIVKTKPYSGFYSMDLNTDTLNTIGQNVPVTPGSKYLFKVHVNGNNGFQGPKNGFVSFKGVTGAGGVTGTTLLPFTHSGNDYKTVSTTVEAASSNMLIEIGTTTPGKFGPIIDEVSLVLLSQNFPPTSVPSNPTSNPVIPNPTSNSVIRNPTSNPVIPNPTSNPVIRNPTSNPVIRNPTSNPVITTSTVPVTLPNDALPTIASDTDSQESIIFTPDSSSVLEDVNTSSTQAPDPSSSIAPSTDIGTGTIVGISILVFFLSLGFVAAFYFLYYKRRKETAVKSKVSALPFADTLKLNHRTVSTDIPRPLHSASNPSKA
jgi:cbb3-type cytochrome oxidase subunit 3